MTLDEYEVLTGKKNTKGDYQPENEGYLVEYQDGGKPNHPDFAGYISWSPKNVFEKAYRETKSMNFGLAVEALKVGKRVCRAGWEGKGLFVFMQVPATIPPEVIPKMQSLPESVKEEFCRRGGSISYSNQLALVKPDGQINGWAPSTSDALAEDWQIHELSGVKAPELPPHQQRVLDEKAELDDRLKKLGVFIKESPVFLKLPEDEKTRLMRQHNCMSEYVLILTARIEAF